MDGSAVGKPGKAVIGGLLRDHKGVVSCLFLAFVGIKESNGIELLAVLKTLELAASREELCGKRFIIELDSANMVNWMRDKSKRPWKSHDIFMRAARFIHGSVETGALCSCFERSNELGDWWSWFFWLHSIGTCTYA
uniref:RNase H type-1 domain-containing protein n=1 Tax=Populus trichocarpa TaxID=3694 RepID=A0A2K1WT71_POPTR